MSELRDARRSADKGFTLIELLVVVVIIGVLIAIAIPLYLNYRKGAENKSAASDLRGALSALEQCYTDSNNSYPTAIAASGTTKYTLTNCSSSTSVINNSAGNTVTYLPSSATAGSVTAFIVVTIHTGNGTWYCYASNAGGSVKTEASSVTIPATFAAASGICP